VEAQMSFVGEASVLAFLGCSLFALPVEGIGQQIGLPNGFSGSPMIPLGLPSVAQGDSRAFWPEPLPVLSNYPLTPSVQPLPQMFVPHLPLQAILTVAQPITVNPATTLLFPGAFSASIMFGGNLSLPIERATLTPTSGPLAFTARGALLPTVTQQVCTASPLR
jgi:hypothetical protein